MDSAQGLTRISILSLCNALCEKLTHWTNESFRYVVVQEALEWVVSQNLL